MEAKNSRDYAAAKELFDAGKFEEAKAAFTALGAYGDSKEQVSSCVEAMNSRDYAAAKKLLASRKYAEAYSAFYMLKGYKDVDTLLKKIRILKTPRISPVIP